jgi:hypothetical protein
LYRQSCNFVASGTSYRRSQPLNSLKTQEITVKTMLSRLMLMCCLVMPLTAFAQSNDTMKQDNMKNGDMKQDQMKNNSKKSKKEKKAKKEMKKNDGKDGKKDDGMKQDDRKQDDGMKR